MGALCNLHAVDGCKVQLYTSFVAALGSEAALLRVLLLAVHGIMVTISLSKPYIKRINCPGTILLFITYHMREKTRCDLRHIAS